jgi:SWI/SNF-related matrix-associated actin-dependent regulator 1 of chromatin subfamily A
MEDSIPDTPRRNPKMPQQEAGPAAEEDAEFDTVATVLIPQHQKTQTPVSQRFTQPTQLIDRSNLEPSSVVQVAASSPMAPSSSPSRPLHHGGGLLSNLMAPSGTHFRPPAMSARPAKRPPALDDDDGPLYRGGSSDEDENTRPTDIKPATFAKFSKSPEKVVESPVNNNGFKKFQEITASAFYRPTSTAAKRTISQMDSSANGGAVKRPRQDLTSRAIPVETEVASLDDIDDIGTKQAIQRICAVYPQLPVRTIFKAYLINRGNKNDTLEYLAQTEESKNSISSEDELSIAQKHSPIAPAKQQIKARERIFDKWSMPSIQKKHDRPSSPDSSKPKRRLIRGTKSRVASPSSSRSGTPSTRPAGRLIKGKKPTRSPTPEEDAMSDESDSDDAGDIVEEDTGLYLRVLKFINSCTIAELADLATTSEDIASTIILQRPFSSLDKVRSVMGADEPVKGNNRRPRKAIGDKVVEKSIEMLMGYEAVDALVARCEELGRPLAAEMKNWGVDIFGKKEGELELVSLDHDSGIGTPATDDDGDVIVTGSRKSRFISQPSIMSSTMTMKNYQVVGINWLSLLFEKELSCILADDMGLGKTCQVIAFLAHLYEKGIKGPHLVVVPASTLENWLREFQKFCPTLHVMPYYARQNERAELRDTIEENRENINVVITTYTVAKASVDRHFLKSLGFCVCVYDEGHMLKNSGSKLYEQLIRIPAQFKLLLTGTPLQNNLQELVSLLGFLLPHVFNENKEDLNSIFKNKAKAVDSADSHSTLLSAQRISRARSMISPFVLRRKKHQVIDLPAKIARVEYCELNDAQKEIYEYEKEQVRKLLADRASGKKVGGKSANILMKLRQAAIHPLLKRRIYNDTILSKMAKACLKEEQWSQSDPDIIFEELQLYNDFECHTMCVKNPKSLGKFALKNAEWMESGKIDKLRDLLNRFKANGDRTLIFSQFTMVMDILEYVLETMHMGFFRLDGRTSVEDRQSILDAFYEQTDIPVFMLSTKAGGAGINLACANKVIIFDSSFNPQEDVQAENRAHRVGQTREVEVLRLVTKGTIEEQIHLLGKTKLALDQRVVGDDPQDAKKSEDEGLRMVEEMFAADVEKEKE